MHGIGQMTFRHNEQVKLFDAYAEALLHNQHLQEELKPTHVQHVLVGCGLTSYSNPALFKALSAKLAKGPLLSLFGADDVAALLYGMAKCGLNDPTLVGAVVAHINRAVKMVLFRREDLPRLLFSFGVLGSGGDDAIQLVSDIMDHIVRFELLPVFSPHLFIMALLGASRTGVEHQRFWQAAMAIAVDPLRQAPLSAHQTTTLLTSAVMAPQVPP